MHCSSERVNKMYDDCINFFFLDNTFCRKGLTPLGLREEFYSHVLPSRFATSLHAHCYLLCFKNVLQLTCRGSIMSKIFFSNLGYDCHEKLSKPPIAAFGLEIYQPRNIWRRNPSGDYALGVAEILSFLSGFWKLNGGTPVPQFPSLSEEENLVTAIDFRFIRLSDADDLPRCFVDNSLPRRLSRFLTHERSWGRTCDVCVGDYDDLRVLSCL